MAAVKSKPWGNVKPPAGSEVAWGDPIAQGMVGCWLMNEGAGINANDIARRNNGVLTGGVTRTVGRFGQSLFFDGVDDYINAAGGLSDFSFVQNTMVFSISWWQQMSSLTLRACPIGDVLTGTEKGFFISNEAGSGFGTNAARMVVTNGSGTSVYAARSPDNVLTLKWQHIAITGNGTAIKIYVNGVSQAITTETALTSLSTGDSTRVLNIGRSNHVTSVLLMNGIVDNVRIY